MRRQDSRAGRERAETAGEMKISYGFDSVGEGEKQERIDGVFDRVAARYDLMNDLMSFGMHRLWKDAMASRLSPPSAASDSNRPWRCLDLAGGTGDMAIRIAEKGGEAVRVCVLDVNASMLEIARERVRKRGLQERIQFVEANAESLPFEEASFDACSIAFGIRNVPRIDVALEEARRVLKYGGQFLCLEFSRVKVAGFDSLYDAWTMKAIPALGSAVAGDPEPYRYLVESIRKFPDQEAFERMIREAGFSRTGHLDMSAGAVALHWGWKV